MSSAFYPVTVMLSLALCILVFYGGAQAIPGTSDQYTGVLAVSYVTGTTHNSTVIRWYPENFTASKFQYANESFYITTGLYDHSLLLSTSLSPMTILTGLESGTQYHYLLQSDKVAGSDSSFFTFPETGSCSFIVYGDTREQVPYFTQLERHKIVADSIAQEPDISFVVNTGDLVYNPDDNQEWDRFFRAGRMLFGTTTFSAVRGNHDSNLSFFQEHFGEAGICSFDCGDAHISLLDSNEYELTSAEQSRWLEEDLASTDKWKIVILHHPLYTSEENHFGGYENLRRKYEPVFLSGNVSVVFNGHVHAYERIEKSGITYITEGRGGAPAYPLNETKMPGSENSRENTLGYSRVTIDPVAKVMRIDVIRIADVSPDLRNTTRIHPEETVIEQIVLKKPGQILDSGMISSALMLLPGAIRCTDNKTPSGQQNTSEQFPFYILPGFWSDLIV